MRSAICILRSLRTRWPSSAVFATLLSASCAADLTKSSWLCKQKIFPSIKLPIRYEDKIRNSHLFHLSLRLTQRLRLPVQTLG